MSAAKEKLVFISHASADAKKARALCKALEDIGFGCWIAPRDIDPGGQYGEEIIQGIESTRGLVLILSEESNRSIHVRDEAERAKHYGKRVIPFRIEDITPSRSLEFYIATSQWIDAFGTHWDEGVSELSAYIAKLGGQAPVPVPSQTASGHKKTGALIAVACLVLAVAGIAGWMLSQRQSSVAESPRETPSSVDASVATIPPVTAIAPPAETSATLVVEASVPPAETGATLVVEASVPPAETSAALVVEASVPPTNTSARVVIDASVPNPPSDNVTDVVAVTSPVSPEPALTLPAEPVPIVQVIPPIVRSIHLPLPANGAHPNASKLVPEYHALVIGINTYTDFGTNGWGNLHTAVNDAREVAETLNQQYGFDVTLLLDEAATRENIMQEMDKISTAYPDQAILIYYAGHGTHTKDMNQGYWIPTDARKTTDDGRHAKQDWVWNSTIQEMLNATKSKHVLMIADACFSGSLFRGAEADKWFERERPRSRHEGPWYRRAIKKKSRYLITSGGLEPVMDGGGGEHSVFAEKVIHYLHSSSGGVFSASDMAHSVREEVSAHTEQRVHMGPLPTKSHEGGEFVFLHGTEDLPTEVEFPDLDDQPIVEVAEFQKYVEARPPAQSQHAAVEMFAAGATNAAIAMLASFGDDPYAKSLVDSLLQQAQQNRAEGIQTLLANLEKRIVQQSTVVATGTDETITTGDAIADDLWADDEDDIEEPPEPARSPPSP